LKTKPLLIYDGNCDFCCKWIDHLRDITGNSIDYTTYQEATRNYPKISISQFQSSVQLIESNQKVFNGAEAVFKALAFNPKLRWLLKLYKYLPGFAFFSKFGYKIIARNRKIF